MAPIADALAWVLLVAGSILMIIGAVGMLRLPDVFARMHGAGIVDTLGAGLMIQAGPTLVAVKLILIFGFILYTSPASTHALARATLNAGVEPVTVEADEEKEDEPSKT